MGEWREIPSPAAPAREPEPAERADRLAAELRASFAARARLYRDMYETLREALGAEEAGRLLARAVERRGAAAGAALFAGLPPGAGPREVAEAFLSAASPDWGRLFPHAVEARAPDGAVRVAVRRCPLKDAWVEDGLGAEEVALMCRIAGRADHGVFGAAARACRFSAETWAPGREGCCVLVLEPPLAGGDGDGAGDQPPGGGRSAATASA